MVFMVMLCSSSKAMTHLVYLSLGSNQGDRQAIIIEAIKRINNELGKVEAVSTLIETEPVGFISSFRFLNGALRLRTALSPIELLHQTQRLERELGRERKSSGGMHYDRCIDIDILLYDNLVIDSPELSIPHPRMYERPFVMQPLEEILLKN